MSKKISPLRRGATGLFGMGLFGALLLLAGCSFVDQALLPSLTGEYEGGSPRDGQLLLGSSNFSTPEIEPGANSSTPAGQQIQGLREELLTLKGSIDQSNGLLQRVRGQTRDGAQAFQGRLSDLESSLERSSPPSAAQVAQQRQEAEVALAGVAQSVGQMNDLLRQASANAQRAGRLVETVTLALTSLTADRPDQEELFTLQEESTRMAAVAYRLQNELSEDILQANNYLNRQRAQLAAIAPPPDGQPVEVETEVLTASDPLVIIRFDRPDVAYEEIVVEAVKQALEAQPEARVYLVAVAPDLEGPAGAARVARDHLQAIMDLLIENEVSASRITPSARTSPTVTLDEVHVFVR